MRASTASADAVIDEPPFAASMLLFRMVNFDSSVASVKVLALAFAGKAQQDRVTARVQIDSDRFPIKLYNYFNLKADQTNQSLPGH